jgi:hypothetical protein
MFTLLLSLMSIALVVTSVPSFSLLWVIGDWKFIWYIWKLKSVVKLNIVKCISLLQRV